MKKVIKLTESDLTRIVNRVIKEPIEESKDSKKFDIYDLFGEFQMAKYKYSDEIQKIINKVASLEKTKNNVRYLNELHKYYEVLHYVPANLMENIELKKKQ